MVRGPRALLNTYMKFLFSIFSIGIVCFWGGILPLNAMPAFATRSVAGAAQVNVTQFHNHDSRDGLYIDSAFTPAGAANLRAPSNSAVGIKSGGSTSVNHVLFNGFRFQKRLDQIWRNIYKRRFPAP